MGASCRPRLALCLHPLQGETSPHSFGQLGGQTDPRWWPSQQLAWEGGALARGGVGTGQQQRVPHQNSEPRLGSRGWETGQPCILGFPD